MDRIIQLKEFLKASPDDSFVQHALALEYIKGGDDEEAKKLFENILNRDELYIGTYYHLAKLHERNNNTADAIVVYEKGMIKAREVKDLHAYNELKAAYEYLNY